MGAGIDQRTLTAMLRLMFPDASFPDGPYERTAAAAIAETAKTDVRLRAQLEQGLRELDTAGGKPFAELDPAAALALLDGMSATTVFQVRGQTISTTTARYGRCSATRGPRSSMAATSTVASPTSTGRPSRGSRRRPDMPAASGNVSEAQQLGGSAQSATHFGHDDDDVVLVIGSGAGGALQRQRAKAVCVAGHAIENARLLLPSDSPSHPDGLANSSGQVGRTSMRHVTASVYARVANPVRMYRGRRWPGS